ncbi:hypothetical protein COV12_02020 [Candidatus Woesearchaeota archaeon CG10_big_fil_rev_8_21_14_0_10_32_24]|nr:MAG: hypothetical protein COV12_02020 [Candidatus Woesearchaeota archaeon CG10_big_fil_rev_8_21_14_0_10_32_24]
MSKKKETIIVMSAHSDDFVIGAGGTIAEYVKEGKKVISIVFSYGEKSHPWLKEKVVQKFRAEETKNAAKALGCEVIIYDLKEGKFYEEYQEKKTEIAFLELLNNEKPTKIFTHSNEDPHPDHRIVHKITLELYKKLKQKPELYIYSIWNPVSFKTRHPKLYVNITGSYKEKIKSLNAFPSQRYNAIYPLFILILFRAIKDGYRMKGAKFGESFYRIK